MFSSEDDDLFFDGLVSDSGKERHAELARQAGSIRAELFEQQRWVLEDEWKFKSLLCPRQAGKSHAVLAYLVISALETPKAKILFIGTTRKVCIKIGWKPILELLDRHGIQYRSHETDLWLRFPNSSEIQFMGVETTTDANNTRGPNYLVVAIDEAQNFTTDLLDYLVYSCISPTLGKSNGTLLLAGTPDRFCGGTYHSTTSPKGQAIKWDEDTKIGYATNRPYRERADDKWDDVEFGWSFHNWETKDNVAQPQIWENFKRIIRLSNLQEDDPRYIREYKGLWIESHEGYVYRYDPELNGWDDEEDSEHPWGLPSGHEWVTGLGIDLGFDNNFAIVVGAWSETCPDYYIIDNFSQAGLTTKDWAAKILEYTDLYNPEVTVGDHGGLGKAILVSMADEYGIEVERAEKDSKHAFIELFNSDLRSQRCKIRKGLEIEREMRQLKWRPVKRPGLKPVEDTNETIHNDSADAGVYLWRYLHVNEILKREQKPEEGSHAYWLEQVNKRAAAIVAERNRRRNLDADELAREDRWGRENLRAWDDDQGGWN